MKDLYQILGVNRSASQDEVKKTYRKLAKEMHPDRHPDDPKVAERFKEISAAYQILGDKTQRQRYDSGEIDADGRERMAHGFHGARGGARAGAGGHPFGGFGGFGGGSAEDIFADIFGGFRRGGHTGGPTRGQDKKYTLRVGFTEAATGGTRRIQLDGEKTLDVKIPAGIESGQQIRLKGQGHASATGGGAGDAMVEVKVEDHPLFTRDGKDIHLELPISLQEAVLGAKISVPTVHGEVSLTIPKNSSGGKSLRLKGKGIKAAKSGAAGDQYVKLQIVLPPEQDEDLEKAVERWSRNRSYSVRDRRFQS